ncbi:glyoxalase/bleomycin resistance/dioxygenase family protein [Tumebacillus algifaecis]|uniref:Glyoxalase/bleomycin resistance/dioxygenase family protein n=2 Tax=Tumebacillus algifaecis TaxID=1214604 RepID=A0A223CY70_9BACL|nr:ArsI/CadI family heavy metal resistance metalloenzyme [Tumebacillus algifaecis]ASS74261.1 glyoxalase/bleomycin resistance/dioxygenase family protein [Tumebacillus algifaecis]
MNMHVAINVRDLEPSLAFYQTFFNAAPTKVRHNYAKFELTDPGLHFSLNVRPYQAGGVINHFGFQVENTAAVLAIKERLQAAGLVAVDEMGTTCCYAVQDKIWVSDPEGNAWEIFYTMADSEFESADEGLRPESACCPTDPSASDLITLE